MNWSLISAVNNQDVLERCLLNSQEAQRAQEVILQRGFTSAASAFNDGIRRAGTDLLVFAHQDVYLPEGWTERAEKALGQLTQTDPNWAVAGIWGVKPSGEPAGHLFCASLNQVLGRRYEGGLEVQSLDEVLLILKKSSGVKFDEQLPGFHMYGTDVCLEARKRGRKSYAISALCIHNTNGYDLLPLQFWRCYVFMRRKWKAQLPISTPCARITFLGWPVVLWNLGQLKSILLGRRKPGRRVQDPGLLYRQITHNGVIGPAVVC